MRRVRSIAVLVALVMATGACGSTEDDGAGGGGDAQDADVAAAERYVAEHERASTPVEVDAPLSEAPPRGMRVNYVQCGAPVCEQVGAKLEEIGRDLGWRVKRISGGVTPEDQQAALNAAAQDAPDGVIGGPVSRVHVSQQIDRLAEQGIPYVGLATDDEAEDGIVGVVLGPWDFRLSSEMMANWVVADSEGQGDIAFFNDPNSLPVGSVIEDSFADAVGELCPSCPVDVRTVSARGIGTEIPKTVVSHVQRNPDVDYLGFGLSDFVTGVPQALARAGLDDRVRIFSRGSGTFNQQNIVDGTSEAAIVSESSEGIAYQLLDLLARSFVGDDPACCREKPVPHRILTRDNIEDPSRMYGPEYDLRRHFHRLWQLD